MSKKNQPAYLFPSSKPFNEGYLRVSSLHQVWYAQYGNPQGIPVIVLHGGPGAGCNDNEMRFFDQTFWHVILLDQRATKRSTPFAEMKENNTQALIADLEKLREHLDIKKWLVFGGSWGSTLALTYGQAHPNKVIGFILRGIFLARAQEDKQLWYGMKDIFPDSWQEFNDFIMPANQNDLKAAYHDLVMHPKADIALPAARAFMKYDLSCSFLKTNKAQLDNLLTNDKLILGVARTFIHYSVNQFFLKENQILNNIDKINHLPLIIVQGRYDIITRPLTAYELHKAWPGSKLVFAQAAGHSAMEVNIAKQLVKATEQMKKSLRVNNELFESPAN
ncbi:proline iminopeptidase [Legionella beliardensis]|uniref:Proline iminopeptidase n=1 Tax=Legionella beliardensis TaxID=91822 RepID=A0A378I1G3_9GAMM|nr:prolyl aminopeptidase [Legionella beliardensis]STX28571.1 proline iminopeptidase [Legionella beliardensis]